jgi:hypothetical protein
LIKYLRTDSRDLASRRGNESQLARQLRIWSYSRACFYVGSLGKQPDRRG